MAFFGIPNIRHTNQVIRLNEQIAEGKDLIVFIQLCILGRSENILEFQRLQGVLEFDSIKFAIAQGLPTCIRWQNVLELTEKLQMHMLW